MCLVIYGYLYNVKMFMMNLYYKVREVGVNVVCFGYFYIVGVEFMDGVLFINLGSMLFFCMRKECMYVILVMDGIEVIV